MATDSAALTIGYTLSSEGVPAVESPDKPDTLFVYVNDAWYRVNVAPATDAEEDNLAAVDRSQWLTA